MSYDAWSGIASCFIVPLHESCADVTMKTLVTSIPVWDYIDSALLNILAQVSEDVGL